MTEPVLALALLGTITAVSIGSARIVSWMLDRRDRAAVQRPKEAAIVAHAHAELAATGWTAQDRVSYQCQRGRAARADSPSFAEMAEFDMGVTACAVLIALVLGGAIVSIVIEQAWLALRRLWKLARRLASGR